MADCRGLYRPIDYNKIAIPSCETCLLIAGGVEYQVESTMRRGTSQSLKHPKHAPANLQLLAQKQQDEP